MGRTLIIGDTHFGLPGSCSRALMNALSTSQKFSRLILTGDILHDKGTTLTRDDNELFLRLTEYAQQGVEIIVTPGNHDLDIQERNLAFLRHARVVDEFPVEIAGRRFLITHGHIFDPSLERKTLIALMEWGELMLRRWDKKHRVLQWIKRTSSVWQRARREFSTKAAATAKARGFEGILCGHTHFGEYQLIGPIVVGNVGCWVDRDHSMMVATDQGLELHWFDEHGQLLTVQTQPIIAYA